MGSGVFLCPAPFIMVKPEGFNDAATWLAEAPTATHGPSSSVTWKSQVTASLPPRSVLGSFLRARLPRKAHGEPFSVERYKGQACSF